MDLTYGDIIGMYEENGQQMGSVRTRGILKEMSLLLVRAAKPGDRVLICDGTPIGKIHREQSAAFQ